MKRFLAIKAIAIVAAFCALFSSINAGSVTAQVSVAHQNDAFVDSEETARVRLLLGLINAKELEDEDFQEWYDGLSDDEKSLIQYWTQQGVINELDELKEGESSTFRKILFWTCTVGTPAYLLWRESEEKMRGYFDYLTSSEGFNTAILGTVFGLGIDNVITLIHKNWNKIMAAKKSLMEKLPKVNVQFNNDSDND